MPLHFAPPIIRDPTPFPTPGFRFTALAPAGDPKAQGMLEDTLNIPSKLFANAHTIERYIIIRLQSS